MLHVPPLALITPFGGGYAIEGSANFADAGANHHNWTPAGTGDSRTVMTVEAVFKLFSLATDQHIFAASDGAGNNIERLYIDATGNLHYEIFVGGVSVVHYETTALFRDFSAWYQVVVIRNGNTVTLYVNGTAVTAFDTSDAPTGDNGMFGHTEAHYIGRKPWTTSGYLDLAIARLTYQDGVAASISDYGKAVGNGWSIADASGLSLGTNGVQITGGTDMAAGTLTRAGTAHSVSKTGTVTATNDSPTNSTDGSGTYGNYANFNDEYQIGSTAYNNATYSQGRTHATYANGEGSVLSQAVALGNGIYFEATLTTPFGSTFYDTVGFIDPTRYASTIANIQESPATGYSFFKSNGQKSDDGATLASYGSAWDTAGKVIGVYISPTGKVWYTIDGTLQNSATESEVVNDTGTSHAFTLSGFGQILPVLSARGSNTVWDLNCGQFAWNTTPYSGYAGLSTANTPAPTVTDMSEHYQTELVAHDGSSTAFTLNWNPQTYDTLFILKNRAGGSEDWFHINTLRGVNKILKAWDTTGGTETTDANVLSISGTTVTLGSTLANANYVVYCFRAGAAGGATNTNGTINSTVSVNPTTGFTLGTFQGTGANGTVGHGSDAALDWLHLRHLNGTVTAGPYAYHSSVGATKALYPNSTSAATTDSTIWNNTAPTATVFSVGSSSNINQNTKDFLFWGFPKKSGAFFAGEMTGNASADGPVFHIDDGGAGGIASMFCIKRHDAGTENWQIIDTARDTYNAADLPIFPNAIVAEGSATFSCDINSNNIKMRSATTDNNTSSGKYAIWGVIEYPFGGDGVEQARAR